MGSRSGSDTAPGRMSRVGDARRLAGSLLTATSLGGGEGCPAGIARALGCHGMRGSHSALMATARQSDKGLQVEQLVAVVDAGRLVNPAIAQIGRAHV